MKIDPLATPSRLWICIDHDTHWPVGGASIVMANSTEEATQLLKVALKEENLNPDEEFTLVELNISIPFARVLRDGNY